MELLNYFLINLGVFPELNNVLTFVEKWDTINQSSLCGLYLSVVRSKTWTTRYTVDNKTYVCRAANNFFHLKGHKLYPTKTPS